MCITCKELNYTCISCAFTINAQISDIEFSKTTLKILNHSKNKWILCQGNKEIV